MIANRILTALPVYNEAQHLNEVLDLVARHADDVLVVDDGSDDGTTRLLTDRRERRGDVRVVTHPENRGYGAALRTAFCYARKHGYGIVVTIDCDGQHEPQRIRELAAGCVDGRADVVSGSRYLDDRLDATGAAPAERREINRVVTRELNERLGLRLTDAFCGFKAYRVDALRRLRLTESGYAMPLELWVQAAHHGLRIEEHAVPRIYLDEKRSFGGELDDARRRLAHYREVIDRASAAVAAPDDVEPVGEVDPCAGLAGVLATATS